MPWEGEGRDGGGTSMSKGMSQISSNSSKASRFSLTPSEETNPSRPLISAFWSSELRDYAFLLVKLHRVWCFLIGALAN